MNELDPTNAGQDDFSSQPETQDAPPAAAVPQAAPADTLYDVTIGGQVRKVPLNELLSGYSRTQDYTKKTMALAEERRSLEAGWQSEREQIRDFLSKRENVQQILQYLEAQNQSSLPQSGPVTAEQFQAALAAERQNQAQERQTMFQEMQMKQTEAGFTSELQKHTEAILTHHPELRAIRGIDVILRRAAAENDPASLDEAKQYMVQAASEQVEAIRAHFMNQQKQAALSKQSLNRGIEPPGGGAPMPTPRPVGKMGSAEFNSDVADYFRQLTEGAK